MDRSSQKSFNFVNLTHPDELKEEDTQLRIRRLAMTEVGKARRKPKTRRGRNEIVLELRSNPQQRGSTRPRLDLEKFGGGNIDPFSPYPLEMDDNMRVLIANIDLHSRVFSSNGNHQKLLRGAWYPVGLSDPATFTGVLANSALYITMRQVGSFITEDSPESLQYHSRTLSMVQTKLSDPNQHTTDALIGNIASLMCHDFIIGANESHNEHKKALMKILELRGGLGTIEREDLRITLSWCDLAGVFQQDLPPEFPMPEKWVLDSKSPPSSPRPCSTISLLWKQQLPMELDWISIFDDVVQLISLDRAFSDGQIEAAVASGCWTEPTIVRLLSIRPLYRGNSRERVIEEVCRLGLLLFLSPIWRALGANPVRTTAFTRNLLWVLNNHMVEWKDLKPLLVWSIYLAAIEAYVPFERDQFVFMLAVLMNGMQIKEWQDLMQVVQSVLWVDKVFSDSEELIRHDVMTIVAGIPSREAWTE
ncbi:hypothetical protein BDV96DRAFT_601240 [Lophiotrema nucula]|uniref:Fungal-specific transcription factor domain-containing protein n=1 Tax=Lophiotrema nucula TaxID=690887 RepID=A0A6A5Z3X1_9PLEO|nr:hypothetical protein BDV96DRAFT_601240 [Lophiotrema nucula]